MKNYHFTYPIIIIANKTEKASSPIECAINDKIKNLRLPNDCLTYVWQLEDYSQLKSWLCSKLETKDNAKKLGAYEATRTCVQPKNSRTSKTIKNLRVADFSYFSRQNSTHILEEFGMECGFVFFRSENLKCRGRWECEQHNVSRILTRKSSWSQLIKVYN